jgi:ABC-2 type transport system ATP-binding protein
VSVIVADGLTKHFRVKVRAAGLRGAIGALFRPSYRDVHAVNGVSFRIEPGEIVGFLGPNGAGKTTTLKMLTGLLHPTAGTAEVLGFTPWRAAAAFKSRIALILGNKQQLIWDLPPEETFLLNRAVYGIPWPSYREALDELVGMLDIGDVLDKPTRQLSLGERMKCELAASLLHRPELLFLDEPTLGLDLSAQTAVRGFIRDYRERYGATVLLTSHYMADVTALAPRVLIINHGRLLYDGGLADLSERLAPVRRIALVLREPVPSETLARYGRVLHDGFLRATLEVPREEVARASAAVLEALPVVDLSVQEPPVEEVIRRAFEGEAEGEAVVVPDDGSAIGASRADSAPVSGTGRPSGDA